MVEQIEDIILPPGKKIYFASDFHLGSPTYEESLIREKKAVSWLNSIEDSAAHVFILGDLFDFWFEYGSTVPKGFIRILGKLMQLRDRDIPVTFFTGNHDMWMFGYFQEEFDIPVYREPVMVNIQNKKFLIGHGDGLGPGDIKYKIIKKIFTNQVAQEIFRWLHPEIGIRLAKYWSRQSRLKNLAEEQEYFGEDEWLVQYCTEKEEKDHHDYYIFGHRHIPLDITINTGSRYINLGDWITSFTYAEFDGRKIKLKKYDPKK